MEHGHVKELLSMYIDEETTAEESERIKEHLSRCKECQQEYEELKTVLSLFNTLEPIEPPEDLKRSIMAKVKNESPPKPWFSLIKNRWIAWGASAAVILIIVGAVGISNLLSDTFYMGSAPKSDSKSEEVGIMAKGDAEIGVLEKTEAEDKTMSGYGDKQAPALIQEGTTDDQLKDDQTKEIRNYSTNGSRKLDVEACVKDDGTLQNVKIYKEILSLTVANLDASLEYIKNLLGSTAMVQKYKQEAIILTWSEKDHTQLIESLGELGVIEVENSYSTDCIEEFNRLEIEKEKLLDAMNEKSYGYEQKLKLQKDLESIEWQITNISTLEIDNIVMYEIRVIEK